MWKRVSTAKDVDQLMEATWGFHDTFLTELSFVSPVEIAIPSGGMADTGRLPELRIHLEGGLRSTVGIELLARDLQHLNLDTRGSWNPSDVIEEATVLIQDDVVYWSSSPGWRPPWEGSSPLGFWFSCLELHWRFLDPTGRRLYWDPAKTTFEEDLLIGEVEPGE